MATDFWLRTDTRQPPHAFFTATELNDVRAFYARLPDVNPTPLRRLRGLAAELGVGELLIKDESARFGLPAFKIVGARYAVGGWWPAVGGHSGIWRVRRRVITDGLWRAPPPISDSKHTCVPFGTSPSRIEVLRSEGAHVIITSAGYDDTVRLMADDAEKSGWTIVSDTPGKATKRSALDHGRIYADPRRSGDRVGRNTAGCRDRASGRRQPCRRFGRVARGDVRRAAAVARNSRTVGLGVPARIVEGRPADAARILRADRDGRTPVRGSESGRVVRPRGGRRCGDRDRRRTGD